MGLPSAVFGNLLQGAMTFQGSLKELHLPDVIQLVSVSGKTGAFHLKKGEQVGTIWLQAGRIVHAEVDDLKGEEAVYLLATWSDGTFHFTQEEASPAHTITKNNTNLLMEAARRLDEWKVLSKRIPSLDLVPKFKVPEGKQGQINLNTQEWLVLSKIDGRNSLREIAKQLGTGTFEVAKMLYGLVTMGLVTLEEPPSNAANSPQPAQSAPRVEAPGAPAAENPPAANDEVISALMNLSSRLRDVGREVMGEAGASGILKAHRQALEDLRHGKGTEAIQVMCHELLRHAAALQGPDSQRLLAEKFREVLASWNAEQT